MYVKIIGLIATILSIAIALFGLSIGGYTKVLKVFFYLRFPPARFYFNAIQAIKKLEALDNTSQIAPSQWLKQGIVRASDVGFKELTKILQENGIFSGEADEIILGEYCLDETGLYEEDEAGVLDGDMRLTPEKIGLLISMQKDRRIVLQRELDPSRITRNLKDWAREMTRNRVANWILIVLALYLIVSIYLAVIRQ